MADVFLHIRVTKKRKEMIAREAKEREHTISRFVLDSIDSRVREDLTDGKK